MDFLEVFNAYGMAIRAQARTRTRPASTTAASLVAQTRRGAAIGRIGRGGPTSAGERHLPGRRGADFSHLPSVDPIGGGMSEPQLQAMWTAAFQRAGVGLSSDPGRAVGRRESAAETNWRRAFDRAGFKAV
jgi:hypothetical protein